MQIRAIRQTSDRYQTFPVSTISKVLERLALAQLRPYFLSSVNFCPFQSGYRTGHSAETALLELKSSSKNRMACRAFVLFYSLVFISGVSLTHLLSCLLESRCNRRGSSAGVTANAWCSAFVDTADMTNDAPRIKRSRQVRAARCSENSAHSDFRNDAVGSTWNRLLTTVI